MTQQPSPGAFLDRDGVLNRRPAPDSCGYVTHPDDLVVLEHARQGVRELAARGYLLIVVTNQRGVARGLMSLADLEAVHARLRRELPELTAVYACPHGRPGEEETACDCRKPRPGLLLRAAAEHELDLAGSLLIGDSDSDTAAAEAAGVPRRFRIESDEDWTPLLEQL